MNKLIDNTELDTENNINLQLAENISIEEYDSSGINTYAEKRKLLEATKIVKQTWSIVEIYQKIKAKKLILSPDYQRNSIWAVDKKTAFIESLFMDILVPPIYVVEIPGEDMLEDSTYEVVDGKQRLTAISEFIKNEYLLTSKALEYYADIFGDKDYRYISENFNVNTSNLLSSVLDIYVITASSPEFTKYDIFSRLNKGSEKLRVNEIRKAIYRSSTLKKIEEFVSNHLQVEQSDVFIKYNKFFSKNDIVRFEDYGRFYRSIGFWQQSFNPEDSESFVEGYNSRPREMINKVLQGIQDKIIIIADDDLDKLMNFTLDLGIWLLDNDSVSNNKIDYIIDACVPFIDEIDNFEKLEVLLQDTTFNNSFLRSVATTTNVNLRLSRARHFLKK